MKTSSKTIDMIPDGEQMFPFRFLNESKVRLDFYDPFFDPFFLKKTPLQEILVQSGISAR